MLTDLLEIVIVELPKIAKYKENTALDNWVKFIKNPEVVLKMSNNNQEEEIKEAIKVLEDISKSEEERYLAELRIKYIREQNAIEQYGIDKGIKIRN